MKSIGQLLLGIVLLTAVAGCRRARPVAGRTWPVMGTFATVSIGSSEALAHLDEAARIGAETFEDLESRLSVFKPGSEISRVNQGAGKDNVEVSEWAGAVLGKARFYSELTDGAFDPTVAPLMRFWGFHGGTVPAAVPGDEAVRAAQQDTGYRGLAMTGRAVGLARARMQIDLGGVAKGFAVDVCFDRIRAAGISNVMVNLGGNIRCGGEPRVGASWTIGVRNPFLGAETLGNLELGEGWAVATSGNYERFVTIGGRRFAHIVDPRSGRPVEGMASVTVISETAVEADAMSTALFVMGPEASREARAKLLACHALFVPDELPVRLLVTPGFRRYFTPHPRWVSHVVELDE